MNSPCRVAFEAYWMKTRGYPVCMRDPYGEYEEYAEESHWQTWKTCWDHKDYLVYLQRKHEAENEQQ